METDLKQSLPHELVDALLESYREMKEKYYSGQHEPAELNGGKFVEACVRILEHETGNGNYTAIGKPIRNMKQKLRNFENTTTTSDTYRLDIPRALDLVYHVRNHRGVGHLGGTVNPNYMDSTLLVTCTDWVLAELLRDKYQCSPDEAQGIVDGLIQRRIPIVCEIDDVKRVLLPKLSQREQTLVLLHSVSDGKLSEVDLVRYIEPARSRNYRSAVLRGLHRDRLIEYNEDTGECTITPMGTRLIEERVPIWTEQLNNGD